MSRVRFVDLIKISEMMKYGTIPDLSLVVQLGNQVTEQSILNDVPFPIGVYKVYKAKLYCGVFQLDKLEKSVSDLAYVNLIRKMEPIHFLLGEVYILADDRLELLGRKQYLFEVTGRLQPMKNKKRQFILAKWTKINNQWVPIVCNYSKLTEKYNPVKPQLQETYRLREFVQTEIPSKLQVTGVEVEEPVAPSISEVPPFQATELGVLQTPYNRGIATPSLQQASVTNPELQSTQVQSSQSQPTTSSQQKSEVQSSAVYQAPVIKTEVQTVVDVNRGEALEIDEWLQNELGVIEEKEKAITEYVSDGIETTNYESELLETIGKNLEKYWRIRPDNKGYTGRTIFKEALTKYLEAFTEDEGSKPKFDIEYAFAVYADGNEIARAFYKDEDIPNDLMFIHIHRNKILIKVIEYLLGLRCYLSSIKNSLSRKDINLYDMIKLRPYRIGLVVSISVADMDKLAMLTDKFRPTDETRVERNIAYIHQYMTDCNELDGSTMLPMTRSKFMEVGYHLTGAEYERLGASGVHLTELQKANIMYYFDIPITNLQLPKSGWDGGYNNYKLITGDHKEYVDRGIGKIVKVRGLDYLIDFEVYKKEVYIYNRLYELNGVHDELSDSDFDYLLNQFEQTKGFKLEERQVQAVKTCLCNYNTFSVITGGAGSGKTTNINAVVYMLINGLGYSEDEIGFVAPTGKAAQRIKEATGFQAKTIHSQFKIGVPVRKKDDDNDFPFKVLFIDESSMINLDLMYQMLQKVPENIKLIFCGDINQLVPIGFGQPFSDMIEYSPVTTLNVMKRAEGTSLVTANAKKIAQNQGVLQYGADFNLIASEAYQTEVVQHIKKLISTGVKLDDIQVISPVATPKYSWGCKSMNKILQQAFNPNGIGVQLKFGDLFKIGDRVIQTQNDYEVGHYKYEAGKFVLDTATGVFNGDLGKVVNIYNAEQMSKLTDDEELKVLTQRNNAIFVVVKYQVVDDTYYIIYNTKTTNADGNMLGDHYEVIGGVLQNLSLAYALTVHKMQGSASPYIVLLWYKMQRQGFLSRNMLYTAITRASKAVTIFGDEKAIEQARGIVSNDKRITFMKKYYKL